MADSVDSGIFLSGERVDFRPLTTEDAQILARWINNDDVTYLMFTGQRPVTVTQLAEEIRRETDNPNNIVFLIQDHKTKKPIGYAGLYELHPTARKAELRIVIGAKEFWNNGFGTEATEMLTFYGFDRLNLNKVWLGVISENKGAARAYEKAGFRHEGLLRQELYRNSRYYDAIRMSIVRDEYYPDAHASHAKRFGRQS